nr:RNA-directed DNA polymerase, eukaryota [Tanacetum cinerariifolium]
MQSNSELSWYFTHLKLIHQSFVLDERAIWIEICGLPLNAWCSKAFKKIASIWDWNPGIKDADSLSSYKSDKDHSSIQGDDLSGDDLLDKEDRELNDDKLDKEDGEYVEEEKFVNNTQWSEGIEPNKLEKNQDMSSSDHSPKVNVEDPKVDLNSLSKPSKNRGLSSKQPSHCSSAPAKTSRISYDMKGSKNDLKKFIDSLGVNQVSFLGIQESHSNKLDHFQVKRAWGNFQFKFVERPSVGRSGCLVSIWDPKDLISKIKALDTDFANGSFSTDGHDQRATCIDNLRQIGHDESIDSSQKTKIKWFVEADDNTKFFHAMVNQKHRYLTIHGIKFEGRWIEDPTGIKDVFTNFFEQKFQQIQVVNIINRSPFYKSLNSDQTTLLDAPVLDSEIKNAIWDCGSEKSPGPDGYSFAFYKEF